MTDARDLIAARLFAARAVVAELEALLADLGGDPLPEAPPPGKPARGAYEATTARQLRILPHLADGPLKAEALAARMSESVRQLRRAMRHTWFTHQGQEYGLSAAGRAAYRSGSGAPESGPSSIPTASAPE